MFPNRQWNLSGLYIETTN